MSASSYIPAVNADQDWARVKPAEAGIDPEKLQTAVTFAENNESTWPRDLADAGSVPGLTQIEPEPLNKFLGPLKPRGGPAGLLLRGGKIAAEWGDPSRVDMTFSIAKSYLAVLCGLAVKDGLIGNIDDTISSTIDIQEFSGEHNSKITWRHLLTQTSEWTGTLFDKPDHVDHYRQVGAGSDNSRKGELRPLQEPGTYWEYNDVRVNVFSLALLHTFKKPLPDVLKERIMDPIGASDTWVWNGYENSTVMVDGQPMTSVPGGTHWGGGIQINSFDHARFGLLIANDGRWGDQQLIEASWVEQMRTPIDIFPAYGFLWWLNTNGAHYPGAPETSFFALGAGNNLIWIDPALDIVGVIRWIDQEPTGDLIKAFTEAIKPL